MASAPVTSVETPCRDLQETALQIRTAAGEEREAARELQRRAFGIPESETPHPGASEEIRVAVREGRVVSCLTLLQAALNVRGARLTMGGIRHVATHPEEQNRGYASALMRDTLERLRRAGVATSVLFPFSFRYYRKFGYELGGNHCHFWCRPNCIPGYAEHAECRPATPEDAPALERFYAERARTRACSMERDAARWRRLCLDPGLRVLVHQLGEIDGFVVTREGRDAYGGRVLKILDLAAATPRAWRALLGALARFQGESVEWSASAADLAASGLMRSPAPLREGYKPRGIVTIRPMFQFRVVDLETALRERAAAFPARRYRLALRIRDELLPANNRPLTIRGGDGPADVRPARPADPTFSTDIRIFSQIFCGYMSAAEAVSQELAECSSPEALELAETLFPAGEPFISELDRF